MYAAAVSGEADVIAGYTSDGRIAQHGLIVIEDTKHVIPPYDAVLLVSPLTAAAYMNSGCMVRCSRKARP